MVSLDETRDHQSYHSSSWGGVWICLTDLMEINLDVLETFRSKTQISTSWWCQRESRRIAKVIRLHLLWTEWFFNNLGDQLLQCSCLHQSGGLTNPLKISTWIWNKVLVTMDNPHCEQFSWGLSLSSHVHTEICGLFWVTRTYLWKAAYVDFYNLLFMALNTTTSIALGWNGCFKLWSHKAKIYIYH